MAAVITPSGHITVPDETPTSIRHALETTSARFCRFTSDLTLTAYGEYAIEAEIGPARHAVGIHNGCWYHVRLLIPPEFPHRVVHTIPITPPLRWHQHQNGDWPLKRDPHANVLCPPQLHEVFPEELLLPYIRHAHKWITAAHEERLIGSDQRYEMPHLVDCADSPIIVYIEGGTTPFEWIRKGQGGIAYLRRVRESNGNGSAFAGQLYRVKSLVATMGMGVDPQRTSVIRDNAFGTEEDMGVVPWVYMGSPVAGGPHRPPQRWKDLPREIQRRILEVARLAGRYDQQAPLLLLAFGIPKFWGGPKEAIVWTAVQMQGWGPDTRNPPPGYRKDHPENWPEARHFIVANDTLRWIRACRDVSPEALRSRSASTTNPLLGRKVALLGVGALGSILAKAVAKCDPADLLLIDHGCVESGNLVRHEAAATDVESYKAQSIATMLQPLYEHNAVRALTVDVIRNWDELLPQLEDCDVVIDATGDFGVHARLTDEPRLLYTSLAWCYVKPGPLFGLLALRRPESLMTLATAEAALHATLPPDVWTQFEAVNAAERDDRDDANNGLVWPTPGCYHPTFDAVYHGMRLMADEMLTVLLDWLADGGSSDVVTLFAQERRPNRYGVDQRIVEQVRVPSS